MPRPTPTPVTPVKAAEKPGSAAGKKPAPVTPVKAAEKPGSAAGKKPAAGKKGAEEENPLDTMPGEPVAIMTPDLANKLNPIVIRPKHAKMMPDAPATRAQLDIKCQPIRISMQWSPKLGIKCQPIRISMQWSPKLGIKCQPIRISLQWLPKDAPREQGGQPTEWLSSEDTEGGAAGGPQSYVRDLVFDEAEVLIAGDHSIDDIMAWSKEFPLSIEVHDRTAVPDPPEFPIAMVLNEDGTPQDAGDEGGDDYVCGIARISMLNLSRGYKNTN
eukprot:gene18235-24686_t